MASRHQPLAGLRHGRPRQEGTSFSFGAASLWSVSRHTPDRAVNIMCHMQSSWLLESGRPEASAWCGLFNAFKCILACRWSALTATTTQWALYSVNDCGPQVCLQGHSVCIIIAIFSLLHTNHPPTCTICLAQEGM